MDVNVKVWLEMSDRTHEAVNRLLDLLEAGQAAPAIDLKRNCELNQPEANTTPKPMAHAVTDPDDEAPATETPAEAPVMAAVPEETASTEVPPFLNNLSLPDLRKAMNETFARLESITEDADLKDKIHKNAAKEFKKLAKSLGYERPTDLPEGEIRGKFVQLLDNMHSDEDGSVTPF